MGFNVDDLVLGDFDFIGEFTAKRKRDVKDPNYAKYGAFYRANYERGILIYALIRYLGATSFLEIGFGRGYATICAAKAFYDLGIIGRIVSIDNAIDPKHVELLNQLFPKEWFKFVHLIQGPSQEILPQLNERFDIAYIDGDHSYVGTKTDWELVKNMCDKCVIFDDYHLPTKIDKNIQCNKAIDEIDWNKEEFEQPELLLTDRRIFVDDRNMLDDQIDYGQVISFKTNVALSSNDW